MQKKRAMHRRENAALPSGASYQREMLFWKNWQKYQRENAVMPTVGSTKERMLICKKRHSVRQKNTAIQKKHPMYGRVEYQKEEEYLRLYKCNIF